MKMRLIVRYIYKYPKCIKIINRVSVEYFARSYGSQRVAVLNQNTLTGRILHYLNNYEDRSCDSQNIARNLLESLQKGNLSQLHSYKNEDIINAYCLIDKEHNASDTDNAINILNDLDAECCLRLSELSPKDIFKILSVYAKNVPHRIIAYKFYELSIEHLCETVDKLPKEELIQLIFYIGLKKRTSEAQSKIRKCLKCLNQQYINHLTTEDLCIVCNSTFKTSTKISNRQFLEKIRTYLQDNLHLLKDSALFTTLIKTIRHNRYQDADLLSTISCTIFFNKTLQYYAFPTICHILALYSDHLYYDENLFDAFTKKALEQMKDFDFVLNKDSVEHPRFKDIKRFLWALSNLNYNIPKIDIKDVIVPQIVSRIYLGEIENDPESLMEIILYLWMMNYKAYDLIQYAFKPRYIRQIRESKSLGTKRLNLLLSCLYFEDREYFRSLNVKAERIPYNDPDIQLRKRPVLKRVVDNLKYVAAKTDINKFELGYQVPYLNVIGITGFKNKVYKAVYIEVLDDFTSVKNTEDDHASGPMQLKLRILEGLEEALIVITEDDIEDMTKAELVDYLISEIELVC